MSQRKMSAGEKWMVEQINQVRKIKQDLSKFKEIVNELPSTATAKNKEEKQLERFKQKIIQKDQEENREPFFTAEDTISVGLLRDWKEFSDALASLQEEINEIQKVLSNKLKHE